MSTGEDYYRHDGVRITHDPFSPGMAEKYGLPGKTDSEGFDPYADSVGAGIYGGIVKRDTDGDVVIGRQYQVGAVVNFELRSNSLTFECRNPQLLSRTTTRDPALSTPGEATLLAPRC